MSRQPKRDMNRRQRRHKKMRYLRARLERTTSASERRRLIAKLKIISPTAPVPDK